MGTKFTTIDILNGLKTLGDLRLWHKAHEVYVDVNALITGAFEDWVIDSYDRNILYELGDLLWEEPFPEPSALDGLHDLIEFGETYDQSGGDACESQYVIDDIDYDKLLEWMHKYHKELKRIPAKE